jgi:hypothetical protein
MTDQVARALREAAGRTGYGPDGVGPTRCIHIFIVLDHVSAGSAYRSKCRQPPEICGYSPYKKENQGTMWIAGLRQGKCLTSGDDFAFP